MAVSPSEEEKEACWKRMDRERVEERAVTFANTVAGLPPPTSSIFLRPRKRVRLRRTSQGFAPLYRLRGGDAKVEVCVAVATAEAALAAAEGGAGRVDLLPTTGGELKAALTALSRCSTTTSLYAHLASPNPDARDWRLGEWAKVALRVEVQFAKASGAAGVVLGALLPDGSLDADFMEKIVRHARPKEVYFSDDAFRAATPDPDACHAVVNLLCTVGVHGLYVSGGRNADPSSARDAIAHVARVVRGRLVVVAAPSGATVKNALKLALATHVSRVQVRADDDGEASSPRVGGGGNNNSHSPSRGTSPLKTPSRRQRPSSAGDARPNAYSKPRPSSFVGMSNSRSHRR
ncbi:hypothetical protein CTAYLR_009787 [Chrysophaeum taylorii]|uniref:Copper homeostasis protein cutC homolog n=1 Tax=Chrysophaeum taylorii TaxID=2483200 RepID=A0AAD7XME5_9STRA|nr:hypothetical protein CTAYLR_009787 [Chrysophaeum taylorii]